MKNKKLSPVQRVAKKLRGQQINHPKNLDGIKHLREKLFRLQGLPKIP